MLKSEGVNQNRNKIGKLEREMNMFGRELKV